MPTLKEGMTYEFKPTALAIGDIILHPSIDTVRDGTIRLAALNTSNTNFDLQEDEFVGLLNVVEEESHLIPIGSGDGIEEVETVSETKDDSPPSADIDDSNTLLDDNQKMELAQLVDHYPEVFSKGISDLGRTDVVQHVIKLRPDAKVFRSKPYPIPKHLHEEVQKQIEQLKEGGLISKSSAHGFVSPILLVPKKDKTMRLCVDFRKLNEQTELSHQLFPKLDDVVSIVAGKKYKTSLDLASGYWQVGMAENSKDLTTFVLPTNPITYWKWEVLPFGLKSAPSTFQRLMNTVFADMISEGQLQVYVDDILVCSETWEEHLQVLSTVFTRLKDCNLKLKISKAEFCKEKLTYLGHTISEDGITPCASNVAKLKNYPSPKTLRETQRLMGLLNYYRRHCAGFARVANPITSLTKTSIYPVFKWTPEAEKAKTALIDKITSYPVLGFPRPASADSPYILVTDACKTGIAAALSQLQDGIEKPIAFYSRALSSAESNLHSNEQELLAIVCAVNHFRQYLIGRPFKLFSDNTGCLEILRKPDLSGKLRRWALMVGDMEFSLHHRPGHRNHVDGLSRIHQVNLIRKIMGPDDVKLAQREDREIWAILRFLKYGDFLIDMTKKEQQTCEKESESFEVISDVLFRKKAKGPSTVVIPKALRDHLMFCFHTSNEGMHFGMNKVSQNLLSVCWWPGLRQDVSEYISRCDSCNKVKEPYRRIRVPMKTQVATYPMETVSSDITGRLPCTERGNCYVIGFRDSFTRFCVLVAIPDQTAETIAKVFVERWISYFGVSSHFLSDQGANYMSGLFREVNKILGINQKRTTPYHPQCNGGQERMWAVMKQLISTVVSEDQSNWDQYIPHVMLCLNQSWHASTNFSPAQLFLGREIMTPTKLLLPKQPHPATPEGQYPALLQETMLKVWEVAREAMKSSAEANKLYYDNKVVPANLDVGDRCYKRELAGKNGLSRKLQYRYSGPYVVTKVTECNAWIRKIANPFDTPKVVHLNMLKKYSGPTVPPLDTDELVELNAVDEDTENADSMGNIDVHDVLDENPHDEGTGSGDMKNIDPPLSRQDQTANEPLRENSRYNLRPRPKKVAFDGFVCDDVE